MNNLLTNFTMIKISLFIIILALATCVLSISCKKNSQTTVEDNPAYTEDTELLTLSIPALDVSGYHLSSLPASKYLEAPPSQSQGNQNSCVAWACANARSYQKHMDENSVYNAQTLMSASYLYNSQQLEGLCRTVSFIPTLKLLIREGVCTKAEMPYNGSSCAEKPTAVQKDAAKLNKIAGFFKINSQNINSIKKMISLDIMPVTSAKIDNAFSQVTSSNILWSPNGINQSGHAFCITGYDDNQSNGVIKILNSWGQSWGQSGSCYIKYSDWPTVAGLACYGIISGGANSGTDLNNGMTDKYYFSNNYNNEAGGPSLEHFNTSFSDNRKNSPGSSILLSGTNSYLQRGIATLNNNGFAISFWVKCSSSGTILSTLSPSGTNTGKNFELQYNTDQKLVLKAPDNIGGWTETIASSVISPGRWTHVVINWDGKFASVFIDGIMTIVRLQNYFPTSGSILYLGNSAVYTTQSFQGSLDDIRIYSRAISISEIQFLKEE